MRSNDQVEALEDGRIDFGFADLDLNALSEKFKSKDMYSDLILHERLYAAVPKNHPLAQERVISLAALKHEKFAILERHLFPSNYDTIIIACQKAGFSPIITDYGDQTPTVLAYVASNMCVSLAPECSIEAWSDHISFIPLKEVFHIDIYIIYREINSSPMIKEIRKIIRQLYPRKEPHPIAAKLLAAIPED